MSAVEEERWFEWNVTNSINSTTSASFERVPNIHDRIDDIVARINFGFMLFGIIGNFLCILVLMQKNLLNRKFNWYLLLLAAADLVFCVIVFTNYYIVLTNQSTALYDHSWITCYFTDYIVNSLDAFCVFLTLILSVDRLYAIIRPIQNKIFFTYRYPKRIAVFGYLALLAIKSPELFLSQRKYVSVHDFSSTNNSLTSTSPSFFSTTTTTFSPLSSGPNESMNFYDIKELPPKEYYCNLEILFSESVTNSSHLGNTTPLIIYILYCNIFIPLLFNIIPALIILVLNLTLWCFIRHYTHISNMSSINHNRSMSTSSTATAVIVNTRVRASTASTLNGSFVSNTQSNSSYLAALSKSRVTKAQKSYYFTIIMLGIWLLLTTIPYYSMYTYYWATSLRFINDRTRLHMTVQAVSSAFFNSNHCINIVIYLMFHKDFRSNALRLVCLFFNLNPFCKINRIYYDATLTSSRGSNDRSVYRGARRPMPEFSVTSYVGNQHIVRICEPTANDIHHFTDKPIMYKKSIDRVNKQSSHYELKSCLNGGNNNLGVTTQDNLSVLTHSHSADNNLIVSPIPSTRSTGSFQLKHKRAQQAWDQLEDTRVFIPNYNLFRCLSDQSKKYEVDENFDERRRMSADGSSNLSAPRSLSRSRTPRKSFWEKFYILGIFSRKK